MDEKRQKPLGELDAETAAKSHGRKAQVFRPLFERPENFAPAELIRMAFAGPRADATAFETELLEREAAVLCSHDHGSLSKLAAGALLESARLRSIFANFLHCMYHRENDRDSADAVAARIIQAQEEMIRLQPEIHAAQFASSGGFGKVKKNPTAKQKAAAKQGALELWSERHAGKHPKLKTVEQFATEVLRRWPVLTSSKVVCDWSANWTKLAKTRNPAF